MPPPAQRRKSSSKTGGRRATTTSAANPYLLQNILNVDSINLRNRQKLNATNG